MKRLNLIRTLSAALLCAAMPLADGSTSVNAASQPILDSSQVKPTPSEEHLVYTGELQLEGQAFYPIKVIE